MPAATILMQSLREKFSRRRTRRRLRAFALLLTSGLVLVQVFPTVAENASSPTTSSLETTTVTSSFSGESATVTNGSESVASEEGSGSEQTEGEGAPSPSPTPPPPPQATSNQEIFIALPSSARVDPRATSFFLPRSTIYSANTLLACISSPNLRFDLGTLGIVDDSEGDVVMISGDRTNFLTIAGPSVYVTNYINGELGLRIFTDTGALSGKGAWFRFVDLTELSLDYELCGDGSAVNYRYLQVQPLGLSQSITKAKVGLEKRKSN